MKSLAPLIGLILIIINISVCLIFSGYEWLNAILSSVIILVNVLLVLWINSMGLKDGFRISLDLLIPFMGLIAFFCVACSAPQIEDNGGIIAAICITAFQAILILICRAVSNYVE